MSLPPHRRAADAFAVQAMVVLCAIWGLQQVAIKLAAPDVATIVQVVVRSGIAAILVGLLMWFRRGRASEAIPAGTLLPGTIAGVLFGAEFLFIALGLQFTSASHIAVFLYTAPIFSSLGLHLFLPGERLRPFQWLGIALCFAGIALAFGGGISLSTLDATSLLGDAFGILAGMSWGATTVVVRASKLSEAPPTITLFYQLAVGFLVMLAIALLTGQFANVQLTPLAVGSVLFQGVIVSFASYLSWFALLRRYLATNLAVFSFMTPLFGVALGVLVLNEQLTWNFVVGAVLVLLGITFVSGEQWLRRLFR